MLQLLDQRLYIATYGKITYAAHAELSHDFRYTSNPKKEILQAWKILSHRWSDWMRNNIEKCAAWHGAATTTIKGTALYWMMEQDAPVSKAFRSPWIVTGSAALFCRWTLHWNCKHPGRKKCRICGKPYIPGSNRAQFCPDCSRKRRREKEAARQRQRYWRQSTHLGAWTHCAAMRLNRKFKLRVSFVSEHINRA